MLSRVFERKNLKIAAHKPHPFPIQKEGLPGLRLHLEPACEQVSLWPGGFLVSPSPEGWAQGRGAASSARAVGALGGCSSSAWQPQPSPHAQMMISLGGSISWAEIKLRMSFWNVLWVLSYCKARGWAVGRGIRLEFEKCLGSRAAWAIYFMSVSHLRCSLLIHEQLWGAWWLGLNKIIRGRL